MKKLLIVFIALTTSTILKGQEVGYNLTQPNDIFELPEFLEEVSALTYFDQDQLAMLHDEAGSMYIYDLLKKEVSKSIKFKGDGDFEGIERVESDIYAIKSNGDLYRFQFANAGVVEEIKTPFNKDNDIEGLGFDPFNNLLLFGLKASGDVGNFEVKGRAIYGYDLAKQSFIDKPLYVILNQDLKKLVGKKFKFRPSGLAINPLSRELYVISSSDRALIVFNTDGSRKNLSKLPKKLFPQPEGIAFAPDGTLFISNEKKGKGGTIVMFQVAPVREE